MTFGYKTRVQYVPEITASRRIEPTLEVQNIKLKQTVGTKPVSAVNIETAGAKTE